jgi:uncharacterized protein YecT (DUF1311 family)
MMEVVAMSRRLFSYTIIVTGFSTAILCSMNSLGDNSKTGSNKDKDNTNKIESYDDLSPYPPIDWDVDYAKEYQKSKKEMKSLYGMIIEVYGNDEEEAKEKLVSAQEAWENYLKKEVSAEVVLYPGGDPYFYTFSKCQLELTKERIARLKHLLNEIYTTTLGMGGYINVNKRAKMMLDKIKVGK